MLVLSYRDLEVWKKPWLWPNSLIYSRSFPREETYGLTSQLRRAASSIPANTAEGRTRGGRKEFIYFLNIAHGSLAELETPILRAQELEYVASDAVDIILAICSKVGKMLNAMIRGVSAPLKTESRKLDAESSHL